jgi:hypothetical protein
MHVAAAGWQVLDQPTTTNIPGGAALTHAREDRWIADGRPQVRSHSGWSVQGQ